MTEQETPRMGRPPKTPGKERVPFTATVNMDVRNIIDADRCAGESRGDVINRWAYDVAKKKARKAKK